MQLEFVAVFLIWVNLQGFVVVRNCRCVRILNPHAVTVFRECQELLSVCDCECSFRQEPDHLALNGATEGKEYKVIDPFAVFPDGAVPASAGAGLVTTSRNRGGVEEEAPGQKEETEGQRREGEGKNKRIWDI